MVVNVLCTKPWWHTSSYHIITANSWLPGLEACCFSSTICVTESSQTCSEGVETSQLWEDRWQSQLSWRWRQPWQRQWQLFWRHGGLTALRRQVSGQVPRSATRSNWIYVLSSWFVCLSPIVGDQTESANFFPHFRLWFDYQFLPAVRLDPVRASKPGVEMLGWEQNRPD